MTVVVKDIISALSAGEVIIEFTSLHSGRSIKGRYTLKGRNIGINPKSDTIVCWDLVNKQWQDIKSDSITYYINKGPNPA
jgi:hypothetical protein